MWNIDQQKLGIRFQKSNACFSLDVSQYVLTVNAFVFESFWLFKLSLSLKAEVVEKSLREIFARQPITSTHKGVN